MHRHPTVGAPLAINSATRRAPRIPLERHTEKGDTTHAPGA